MSKPILEIQHIGKKYRIQQSQQPYISLRDSIGQWFKPKSQSQDFWALNDVSFTVNAGDTIGIIGKNGAGKSTLLKILSRITPPTTGKVISRGRIASLLEVGTGFHPELSGRENVFMNGSILGMRRAEIKTHFDAIVDFAGVAQFIDTPLKHYSSGMQLRLAFAVAAFLQNEILIIDEVLAVGDAEFQKKCLGKMDEVSKSGRTVLFVSHNMASVKSLCKKGLVLVNGKIEFQGTQTNSIIFYQNNYNTASVFNHNGTIETAPGNSNIRVLSFKVLPKNDDVIQISSGILFELVFFNYKKNINLDVTFELSNSDEIPIYHGGKIISNKNNAFVGKYKITGIFPENLLNAGIYKFKLIFGENQRDVLYIHNDVIQFEVLNETLGSNSNILPGIIRPQLIYTSNFID